MSYFVLTLGLRASLLAAAPARVVSTASDAHKGYTLDFEDLQGEKGYSAIKAYGRSKLCNILFTRELGRRFSGTGVTANCLHPGFVATRFGDASGGLLSRVVRMAKTFAISPEKGAANISGQYFYRCRPAVPTEGGRDDAAATRLWTESAKIAGIDNN
jgi:NAD(P)-dependent dehydrogenase (short-subunit alcohol dehydrogenase family)